jgi:hypothetical protein
MGPNIAGKEGQIEGQQQAHTEGRYALQNITDLAKLLFLVSGR